ncbi:MAG: rRNA maturation RNase YbeY [Propionibacteriales bacterium]|nr:rRNA maturation RNase YbeY [Propionibacteriales bacterium]
MEVLNESGVDADVVALGRLSRFVLDRMRIHPQSEMCLKLVDEATISELNARWMDKQGPTDVLAFPMDELRPGRVDADLPEGVVGDIVLCPQVAAAQAETNGQSAADEVELLTVHGLLHLLGYDHAEPDEHREMFGLQARLLAEWQDARAGEDVEATGATS